MSIVAGKPVAVQSASRGAQSTVPSPTEAGMPRLRWCGRRGLESGYRIRPGMRGHLGYLDAPSVRVHATPESLSCVGADGGVRQQIEFISPMACRFPVLFVSNIRLLETFGDGRQENVSVALSILRRHGFAAAVFVAADVLVQTTSCGGMRSSCERCGPGAPSRISYGAWLAAAQSRRASSSWPCSCATAPSFPCSACVCSRRLLETRVPRAPA